MLVNLDADGKRCWVTGIRETLGRAGFHQVWLNQGIDDVKTFIRQFKQRLVDMYMQEWSASIRDSERYILYRSLQSDFGVGSYFKYLDIYCFRVAFTQARLGSLPINNNMMRFCENPSAKFCPVCQNVNEDEFHLFFVCPLYNDLRERFLGLLINQRVDILLNGMCKQMSHSVAKFIFHSIKRRCDFVNK